MTKLSYQLYSSRNFGPLDETLRMLGQLGYAQVEGWGGLYDSLDHVGKLRDDLDANGLHMATGHFGFDMLQARPKRVTEIARVLDMKAIFVPAPPGDEFRNGKGDWAAFAADLAEAGKPYWDAGLHFGYHNHDWEFHGFAEQKPLDLLMEASEHLMLELDVAWAVRAHQSPLTWIQRYKDRIMAAHIKDIAPAGENQDEDGWADVGHGTMDWQGLWTALTHAECEYFVAEHDNPNDDRRFAERSIAAIRAFE